MGDLKQSYAICGTIARRAAKNFYYSFLLLPRQERRSMCALYAFLRRTDDLADNDRPLPARRAALDRWRDCLSRALASEFDDPILPALADTMARYRIPHCYLLDVIDGVEMDLNQNAYETFDELRLYCQRVASAVGLACLRIWGCDDPRAEQPASECGVAFQLTNILRDLKEDLQHGRVYLPQEDLRCFHCDSAVLGAGGNDARFRALMRFEIQRTESFYESGARVDRFLTAEFRPIFWTMTNTYRALLAEIKRREGDVLTTRVRLTPWHKWRIAAGGFFAYSRTASWLRGGSGG